MSGIGQTPEAEEIGGLRATVARLTARIDELDGAGARRRQARRQWLRRGGAVGVAAAAGLLVVGVAGATPTTSTTDVTFVPVTPTHVLFSGKSIAANKSFSAVVIGGATTAPTNATTVQVKVSAKGAAGGVLNFYPAGNVGGGSGQFLSYPSGNGTVSETIEENVGLKDELTFANTGSGSATVTATLLGYSTQVTAGDMSPTGGTAGQVLTNTGVGAVWQTHTHAYSNSLINVTSVTTTASTILSLAVPAGSYEVSAHFTPQGGGNYGSCYLMSPGNNPIAFGTVSLSPSNPFESASMDGLVTTTGGNLSLSCYTQSGTATFYYNSIVATQVDAAFGEVTPNIVGRSALPGQR
jgi:hypothetical protein